MEAIKPITADHGSQREQALRALVRALARQAAAEWVREREQRLQDGPGCR